MCQHCYSCNKNCHKKKDISGLYAGKITFPTFGGATEGMTLNIGKDGTFSDLEMPAFGQWKSIGCGKYQANFIDRRQTGDNGGILKQLKLWTETDYPAIITSFPNYIIYGGFEFTIEDKTFIAPIDKIWSKVAHAEWSLGSGLPELPFSGVVPSGWELELQPITDVIESAKNQ